MLDPLSCILPDVSSVGPTKPTGPARRLLQPNGNDTYTLEVDYSSISEFMRCKRAGENKLVRAREATRDATATSFGKLFHLCEETRLRVGYVPGMRERQLELITSHYQRNPVAVDEYRSAARMVQVTEQYNNLYANDLWPAKVYQHEGEPFIERPYKIPLCSFLVDAELPYRATQLVADCPEHLVDNPALFVRDLHIVLTGRIDCILSDSNALWVVDHKTSSRGGKEYEEAFFLSLQTRGYCWAAQRLGIPVVGLIMNGIVVRPLTKTGTGTEFVRPSYFYSPDSLLEYEENMQSVAEDFVHCLTTGRFPQLARSFKSPCAGCDYQDNCRTPRDQRLADLASGLYRDVTWNPMDNE